MVTSHAPLLAQRDRKPVGSTIVGEIARQAAKLPSDRLFWAAMGSMAVSLVFRPPVGRIVRRTVGRFAVPLLILGVFNRMKTKGTITSRDS